MLCLDKLGQCYLANMYSFLWECVWNQCCIVRPVNQSALCQSREPLKCCQLCFCSNWLMEVTRGRRATLHFYLNPHTLLCCSLHKFHFLSAAPFKMEVNRISNRVPFIVKKPFHIETTDRFPGKFNDKIYGMAKLINMSTLFKIACSQKHYHKLYWLHCFRVSCLFTRIWTVHLCSHKKRGHGVPSL